MNVKPYLFYENCEFAKEDLNKLAEYINALWNCINSIRKSNDIKLIL